ncbi:hypothetical protein GCM10010399_83320 [Dactylosporangium fulvum]|uniref:Antibiotic biosynthesis monooxygenase n=1 Tax=Dactylosporangium fulvum TaxID=53359 RepID=A0ABY5W982_9ACTN|nr:antibiotic biosynthesis monooxygenase [Dactylosporangium fulvum]UWP86112.1 antibiotic biosynthesis monooxygenase [Dactylosporangium fulvum]
MPSHTVRVIVYLRAAAGGAAALREAYRATDWAGGKVPGMLGCELLRDAEREDGYCVLSEWETLDAFRAWQLGPEHTARPSALRPFQDRRVAPHYRVFEPDPGD